MLIESRDCGTPGGLNCREIHPVCRARADQPSSAHMHFADRSRHLLDRADFLNHETVRQKSLIDQLHDALIVRLKPDRSKILAANFHALGYDLLICLLHRARDKQNRSSPGFAAAVPRLRTEKTGLQPLT